MIAVVDYGIGNLRSAQKALQHLGAYAVLTADPDAIGAADAVVLPGVGSFGRCMESLRSAGLEEPTRRAIDRAVPFLGICVGMQMLYAGSEESPGVAGMGVLDGVVRRLAPGVKRPQMQWNRLMRTEKIVGAVTQRDMFKGADMLRGMEPDPWMYFVHSYAPPADGPYVVATCDYGGPVAAAVVRDRLWATQFHPEKSGRNGLGLLANFLAS